MHDSHQRTADGKLPPADYRGQRVDCEQQRASKSLADCEQQRAGKSLADCELQRAFCGLSESSDQRTSRQLEAVPTGDAVPRCRTWTCDDCAINLQDFFLDLLSRDNDGKTGIS